MNNLVNIQPQPNDLVVIPDDMELNEPTPFLVHKMKFLQQPSIIRSGGYNMNSISDITLGTIARWLGKKIDDFVKPSPVVVEAEPEKEIDQKVTESVSSSHSLPTFFRHLRFYNEIETLSGIKRELDPKGGVTLYVELNPAEKTLAFSYALCHTSENFNKNIGRLIAKGRFESEDWYEVENCDDNLDVTENIGEAIYDLFHNSGDSVKSGSEKQGPGFISISEKVKFYDLKTIYERI